MSLEEINAEWRKYRAGQSLFPDDPDEPTKEEAWADWHDAQRRNANHLRGSGERRSPYARTDTLNNHDRRSLEIQTGRSFDTQSEAEAWAEVNDYRFAEKGDRLHEAKREISEWMDSGETIEERGGNLDRKQTWSANPR